MQTKHLIVNADDFGQSSGINRGIIEAHEHGIVTSTSLMSRWPGAVEAAQYARTHSELSVGLHIDLGEWEYREGNWVTVYSVVPLDDVAAVKTEITAQLTTFRRLLGRDPTHIDSHQHVHVREPTRSALLDVAAELYIPIRHLRSEVRYCGNFYGQTAEGFPRPDFISVQAVVKILEALPEGFTELGCHPGEGNDLDTMYRGERAQELKVLCDPQIRTTIDDIGIELCSFAKLPADWHRSKVLV